MGGKTWFSFGLGIRLKYINLNINRELVINWITTCFVMELEIAILICYCRTLFSGEWTIFLNHEYHEVIGVTNGFEKRGRD